MSQLQPLYFAPGVIMLTDVIVVALAQLSVHFTYWTVIHAIVIVGSLALWILYLIAFNYIDPDLIGSFNIYRLYVDIVAQSGI